MDYSKLFSGSIFNPPSYSENFISSSSEGWPIYLYINISFWEDLDLDLDLDLLTLYSEIRLNFTAVLFFGA